ncbi:hypothetical protein ONO39_25280, partial [Salmonella enterica subsp. enterica serovar Anatum]|nr:hypothetical protein [Salmonella enterica subsp. enterica serovar Anatum]
MAFKLAARGVCTLEDLADQGIDDQTRHFYDALQGARTAFILECKKASPSKGVIRDDFDPARIASIY